MRVIIRWPKRARFRQKIRRRPAQPRLPKISARALGYIGLALLATLFVHDLFGDRGYFAMKRIEREAERLSREIQKIDSENRTLAEQVKGLKSDPQLIERIAREEMGLARPNELIFRLPPRKPTE